MAEQIKILNFRKTIFSNSFEIVYKIEKALLMAKFSWKQLILFNNESFLVRRN